MAEISKGLTTEERIAALEEREEWRRRNPLSAALDRPGIRRDRGIVTISPLGMGFVTQEETTSAYGPDGFPVRDTRAAAIPVRPRIRHEIVRG